MASPLRFLIPLATFVLGGVLALSLPLQAQPKPAEVRPAAQATVRHLGETELRAIPSGKASVRILARGDNAFIGLLTMAGGGQVPEHRDASEEYIHVMKGSGKLFIDDKAYDLKAGTTVFMPANSKVRYENGPEELMALQVFAGPESAAKYDGWKVRP